MGTLKFICGTMGAGKTSKAIQLKYDLNERQLWPMFIVPRCATEEDPRFVHSRDGKVAICMPLGVETSLSGLAHKDRFEKGAIIVDEAQFLAVYQVDELRAIADTGGLDVFCFGLRTDFRGTLFPASARLLELADEVEVLKAPCSCGCGRDAVVSARVNADGTLDTGSDTFEIGDLGRYVPMCAECFADAKAHAGDPVRTDVGTGEDDLLLAS